MGQGLTQFAVKILYADSTRLAEVGDYFILSLSMLQDFENASPRLNPLLLKH